MIPNQFNETLAIFIAQRPVWILGVSHNKEPSTWRTAGERLSLCFEVCSICTSSALLHLFSLRVEMEALVDEGAFLEHAVFGGNMYGTSRASVAKVAGQGKICILDIDMQGVKQIKQSGLKARCVPRERFSQSEY